MKLISFSLAAALALAPVALHAQSAAEVSAIHDDVLVLDSHADILLPSTHASYYLPDGSSRISLDRLEAGGVDAIVLALQAPTGPADAEGVAAAWAQVEEKLATVRALLQADPGRAGLALDAEGVRRLNAEGKIAALLGFQNAYAIGSDLSRIDYLHAQGVRVFGFNHLGHNALSDSSRPGSGPTSLHGGLSELGREGVKRLNDLGIVIDVSQLSSAALVQTLELSRAPVAATHSAARALVDNARNLTDGELDAIKANGGVVQVTPFWAYVHNQDETSLARAGVVREKYGLPARADDVFDGLGSLPGDQAGAATAEIRAALSRGTVSDFVDHIDHIASRIGWQHVGIGTDFDHGAGVEGFDSAADARNVTAELLKRGYDREKIAAIWGGNFLRVLEAAQAAQGEQGRED